LKSVDKLSKEERKAIFVRKMRLLDLYGACMKNAGMFIDEAKILLQHSAFPRAAFLAYCSIEEAGKAQIVADFYNGDLSEEEFRNSYYSHQKKAAYPGRVVQVSGTPLSEAVTLVDKFSMQVDLNKGAKLREYREPALYVGFDGDFNPVLPEMLLNQEGAEAIIAKAYKTWRHILEMDAIAEGIGSRGHFK
jgi:AbiV family abortive infection protein